MNKREESQEKNIRGIQTSLKWKVFMVQKGLWNLVRDEVLQDRGALPEEEGDVMRVQGYA